MRFLKAQWLLCLSLVFVFTLTFIVSYSAIAFTCTKYAYSQLCTPEWWEIWLPSNQLVAKSTSRASHLRVWAAEVVNPHAHSGDGYAEATVGTTTDKAPSRPFTWLINTGTFPRSPGSNTASWSAGATGIQSDSAYTYCWVSVSGEGYSSDSASN